MIVPDFTPFPELKTKRLLLRQITVKDVEEIFFLRSDPAILKYVDKAPAASREEAKDYIKRINTLIQGNESILWGITVTPEDPIIGTVCFWNVEKENDRAETGFVLHTSFQGKGIMKEALSAVLQYGFDIMKLHSVFANVNPLNESSINLLNSLGFQKEAYFKENYFYNGKFYDTAVYTMLGG